ncbi:MAG: serine/threonine-protein kinase [Sandaracinaceae bacterium]
MAVSLREVVSFGRYEPLFRIASGGMAEVYAARIRGEAGFQKLVAVKRMHPHLATDTSFVDMFLNEARLAAHIASPYVVSTLDLGRGTDGSLYIVMELVVGLSLATLMEDCPGPLPPPVAIELIAQAAQGLDDAHEATTPAGDPLGLIHRDISPHNLLLGIDGRARVTDFGIAHAVHRPREETNVKELKGKFAYMSPEQTRLRRLDRRTDVFSLGVVAWEALTGERLFADDEPRSAIKSVRNAPIPPPHRLTSDVDPIVSKVVLRALDRKRKRRFATAADFANELRRAGRQAYHELPTRRQIGTFVKERGGDELERLRRLIRLGTEGADEAAIEAVKPGVTRVLAAGDLSGVARVGTGKKRVTDVLDPNPPSVSFVTLDPDDEPDQVGEVEVLSTRELAALRLDPIAPPRGIPEAPTGEWDPVEAARPTPRRVLPIALVVALAIVAAALLIAGALLYPWGEETVPLPSDLPRETPTESASPEPEAAPSPSTRPSPPEPPTADEPAADGTPRSRPRRRRARRQTPSDLMGVDAFDRSRPQ